MDIGDVDRLSETFDRYLFTRCTALRGIGGAGLAAVLVGRGTRFVGTQADSYPKTTIPGGLTEITLDNQGPSEHHPMFMLLHDGKTVDDFKAAVKLPDFGALFGVSTAVGGPGSIDPGQKSTVVMDLKPGQYVVICAIPDEDGMPHYQMGMLSPLEVTAAAVAGTEPVAETTIDLIDFSFENLPAELTAGKHTWKITDTGEQLHEMGICMLSPGVSFDQVKAMFLAPPPGTPAAGSSTPAPEATPVASGGPPFISLAGAAPMNPAETVWAMLDLEAGDYFAICFVPDTKTGAPHFMLGMIMPFTVN